MINLPDIPDPWTVGIEWNVDYGKQYYGLNKNTGFETSRCGTYEEVLEEIKETNSGETSSD